MYIDSLIDVLQGGEQGEQEHEHEHEHDEEDEHNHQKEAEQRDEGDGEGVEDVEDVVEQEQDLGSPFICSFLDFRAEKFPFQKPTSKVMNAPRMKTTCKHGVGTLVFFLNLKNPQFFWLLVSASVARLSDKHKPA
jgi:hypothetical protein